jgi:ribosomal-protein-alanine N-acetyltransferase
MLRERIATALLTHLFERADEPGEQYTLEVRPSNAPAIALYERFGFRSAGLRRGYYHDNKEDAVIMWRVVEGGANGDGWVAPGDQVARRSPA